MARGQFKYQCDEAFFEVINTEEKAYWLGFILADGYINLNNGPRLEIGLKNTDEPHLKLFQQHIQSNHPIRHRDYNNCQSSTLTIYNKKLVEGLIKHGITQAKSLTALPYTDLPYELVRHYIRGILDGDGSVYCYKCTSKKRNTTQLCRGIRFYGTKAIIDYIVKQLIASKISKADGKCLYCTDYTSCKDIVYVAKYLYSDYTVALPRKVEVLRSILGSYKQKSQKELVNNVKL